MKPEDQLLFQGFKAQGSPMKYFKLNEFDSPDSPGSGSMMDIEFLKVLDKIREDCGFPFKITSGYRTEAHNQALKDTGQEAVDDSAHTRGKACDIAIYNGSQRMALVKTALKYGINRCGIGKTFCHLDSDITKPRMVMWLYSHDR